eukprot:NODE_1218_length_1602_cov_37.968136_g1149_i0.p1 GENE.NODE_1218_length_1602_cov_37.968136_g1149_i0~~NODE_1218_length_1602_cov_37.968136_g1149_i0.p1  ORF type:complete len:515 (-),score=139.14 NODE_1218_length_1602_cov_37.968136_g1149_i0:56-1534(-)
MTTLPMRKALARWAHLDAEPNIVVLETNIVDNAACAARDFELGESVFREEALMILPKQKPAFDAEIFEALERVAADNGLGNNYLFPIYVYHNASEETRGRVMEFFCPELEDDVVDGINYLKACQDACSLPHFTDLDPAEMVKFLLILRTNQHAAGQDLESTALFELGSKVTHSCDPNCLCVMNNTLIEYRAIRPIKTHEMLTFSYISSFDLWRSTPERRKLMQPTRFFECCCSRCVGPDLSRRLRCPSCSDHRTLYHQPGQVSFVPTEGTPTDTPWTCQNPECGKTFPDTEMPLEMEAKLAYTVLETYFNVTPGTVQSRDDAKHMLAYCDQELGHYHWVSALMVYTQIALFHSARQHQHAQCDPPNMVLQWCRRLRYWFRIALNHSMEQATICRFLGSVAQVCGDQELMEECYAECLPGLRTHWRPEHPAVFEMEAVVMASQRTELIQQAMIPEARQLEHLNAPQPERAVPHRPLPVEDWLKLQATERAQVA